MLLHAELFVASMERSLAFYVGRLGLEVVDDRVIEGALAELWSGDRHSAMRRVLLKVAPVGLRIALVEPLADERAEPAMTGFRPPAHRGALTFLVPDLADRMAALRTSGLAAASEIFEIDLPRAGRSSIVFYEDPDGHSIEILQVHRRSPPLA